MKNINQIIGKFFYAIAFLILIPLGLWLWAKYTENIIHLPIIESKLAGWILIIIGGSIILWAMFFLKQYGKGLPMNAYPPPRFVKNGPYRFFRHPIYLGFGILIIGYFILTGSASGLWLISPITIMGMIALVLGYEEIDLKHRFPNQKIITVLDLPENNTKTPDLRDILASLFWIISFLILCNFLVTTLNGAARLLNGEPHNMISLIEYPYLQLMSMLFLIIVPFFLKRKDILREWAISSLLSLCYFVFFGLQFPAIGIQYSPPQGLFLLNVPIFLILISLKALYRQSLLVAIVFTIIALTIIILQLANSPLPVLYIVFTILIFILSAFYMKIWSFIRRTAERIANSWKEWVFGKVRVINHGFYIGFGAFFGILFAGILAGQDYAVALLVFSILVTIGSALWAQLIEGSEKLKRPFGYYGGLVGILFGSLAVWAMGLNVWVVIGVASVVMPWVQAMGRLRCLINGCCHGSRVENPIIGIRYFHPRSRVCNISNLKGELLHPTQLYSILWLLLVGIVLITLWHNSVSSSFIFGLYLILTGLGRFVEEAYRGEAQTPKIRGLRLYQWTAVFSVIIGIIMTTIQIEPAIISPGFSWKSVLVAATSGFFLFFVMGVDFPYSNARFSRLV